MKPIEPIYKKEEYGRNKQAWLDARGIGGSASSAILGKNPYMTILDLYQAIVQPRGKKIVNSNEAMDYGTKCEDIIRKQFKYDFENLYKTVPPKGYELYRRVDKPYLTATIDGTLITKKGKVKGILEIKTHDIRNKADAEEWKVAIPPNYYIQVIHYLMVLNDFQFVVVCAKLRYFDYFNKDGKKLLKSETIYHYIDRNEVLNDIQILENAVTNFWENNVQKKVMPKLTLKL